MPVLTRNSARLLAQSATQSATKDVTPVKPVPRTSRRADYRAYEAKLHAIIASYEHLLPNREAYEQNVIRHMLDWHMNMPIRDVEYKKINVYVIYEFLARNTRLLETHERFRNTVRTKLADLETQTFEVERTVNTDKIHKAFDKLLAVLS
jgi:hypothetical protein